MLVELYCDKFMSHGVVRPRIEFGPGLNAVVGSSVAKNSIGKTTLLLAIDFAFGGSTYASEEAGLEKIGPHRICFAFQFGDSRFWFARHTGEQDRVWKCDSAYQAVEEIGLDQYKSWLAHAYGTDDKGGTFRDLVGPFLRVYGKHNYNEQKPLDSYGGERESEGVERILKLYGQYLTYQNLMNDAKQANEQKTALRKAGDYQYVHLPTKRAEVAHNELEIARLDAQITDLESSCSHGTIDLDPIEAEREAELRATLSTLRRQRTRLKSSLQLMEDDLATGNFSTTNDFSRLLEFFPQANLRHLEEIEGFHKQLTTVLKAEHKASSNDIKNQIAALDDEIAALEEGHAPNEDSPQISTAVLRRYAELSKERDERRTSNEYYEESRRLGEVAKAKKDKLNNMTEQTLSAIETRLNGQLSALNEYVCGSERTAPVIEFRSVKSYSFDIPNDTGTGSRVRGMFLLDYALLEQTCLPVIMHDTNTIKQVEDKTMVRLMELYDSTSKQVFIAVDKAESFTDDGIPEILERNTVLRLGDGDELFGYSWAKKDEGDE